MPGWGTAIGAGVGLVSGLLGSRSAKKAAEQQRQAAQQAMGVNQDVYNQQRSDWSPYSGLGATGANQLTSRLGDLTRSFTNEDFVKDPGYDFRMQEGSTALQGGAAAKGGLYSGAAGKALTRYGQNFASNEFDKAYGRFTNDQNSAYNKLMGLVGAGTQAAGATSSAAGQYGQNAIGLLTGQGNAAAAGTIGAGNAIQQGLGQGYNAYRDNQIMDYLKQNQSWGRLPTRSQGSGYGNAYERGDGSEG